MKSLWRRFRLSVDIFDYAWVASFYVNDAHWSSVKSEKKWKLLLWNIQKEGFSFLSQDLSSNNAFISTIGVEIKTHTLQSDGKQFKLQVWKVCSFCDLLRVKTQNVYRYGILVAKNVSGQCSLLATRTLMGLSLFLTLPMKNHFQI